MKLHFIHIFHRWYYSGPYEIYRVCSICGKSQFKIWTDSGILSKWFNLRKERK